MAEKKHKHEWYPGGYVAPDADGEYKVVFDCSCGETRHVEMTDDGVEKIKAAIADPDPNNDPGRIPAEDLVKAVPA